MSLLSMRLVHRLTVALSMTLGFASASAQELEPRVFSYAPTGLKFVVAATSYATGDLVFDPTVPIEDANADVSIGAIGYVSTFGLLGKTAKVSAVLPYAHGRATGRVNGVPAERILRGFADARIGLSWLLYGAPARTAAEFMKADRSRTVSGVSFLLGLPTGAYDEDRLLNIGTNRFWLRSEVGVSHAFLDRRWTLEASAAATIFQDNDEWLGSSTREQDPVFATQAHLVRDFRTRLWIALDATYYWGGQAMIDGVQAGGGLSNSRLGLTLSLPIAKTQSLKFTASSGVTVRTGTDFDSVGMAWQWAIPPRT